MAKFTADQISAKLAGLPGWKLGSGAIEREITVKDFAAAIALVDRIAAAAESAGHHPDIDIRYSRVRLALCTHEEGGITEKDVEMAAAISDLLRVPE